MSSFLLKFLGVILMTIDHARFLVFTTSDFAWMDALGRMAFPIFAFQIVMGYKKTQKKKKYIKRLLIFAVISEAAYKWMIWLATKDWMQTLDYFNVYWTFALGLVCLRVLGDNKLKSIYKGIIVGAICVLFSIIYTDYSFYGIGIMIAYYYLFPFKENKKNEFKNSMILIGVLTILTTVFTGFINVKTSAFLPISAIAPYGIWLFIGSMIPFLSNGKKGLSNKFIKWMFYIYYPLHITILCLINFFK